MTLVQHLLGVGAFALLGLTTTTASAQAQPGATGLVASSATAVSPSLLSPVAATPTPGEVVPPLRAAWSVAVLAEATRPWGVLPGQGPDTRQTIGAFTGWQAQLGYQAGRWHVRSGFGEARVRGQFDGVSERTGQTQVNDTLNSTVVEVFNQTDTSIVVHYTQSLEFSPVINVNGQIIGYDSVWIGRYDTLYQIIIIHDTIQRTTQSIITRLDTWRERREQQLRPTYRFWTIPLAVQVDLMSAGRWAVGLSVGSQLTIFRGGDQPVRRADGAYELRRTGPRDGPFRPVSLALTSALEARYQLSERLSLRAGAGGRGWAVSPVKGESRVRLQPTAQLGFSWALGRL